MAAIAVSVFEPVLGKNAEALHLMKEAQEIVASAGANVQVAVLARGGIQGQLTLVAECNDTSAYGALLDKLYADEGYQQFVARAQAAQVVTPVRTVDYVEIPGFEVAFDKVASKRVIMASLFLIRDGRQEDSLDRIGRWKKLTEKHGATSRAMQALASDPAMLTATVSYYDSFTAWGKSGQALNADPEWQKFVAEIRGKNASANFLRTSLMQVV